MTDSRLRRFAGELRKRKVMRAAIAYVVVAWAIMEGGELIFTALKLPEWTVTLLVALAILGFPLALVLAWAYELTPDGLQRDVRASAGTPVAPASPPAMDESTTSRGLSIAVLPFDDMSEKKDQGYFCEGIAEEILNTLSKVDNLRVAWVGGASGSSAAARRSCDSSRGEARIRGFATPALAG